MGVEVVFECYALPVRLDLGLGGKAFRPVRVEVGREAVVVAWNVACATGIGVVSPCSTDVVGLLENLNVKRKR